MLFARRVFLLAGLYGLAVVILGYGFFFLGGEDWSVYTNHPEYVHGFFLVTLAWQVAFLLIATDPLRFRLLMLAAMLEKFPYTLATLLLYSAGEVGLVVLAFGLIDGVLGALFSVAYIMTEREARAE